MSDATDRREDGLVFMVSGDDEIGDHHIFVSSSRERAEARYQAMLTTHASVKANWLPE